MIGAEVRHNVIIRGDTSYITYLEVSFTKLLAQNDGIELLRTIHAL